MPDRAGWARRAAVPRAHSRLLLCRRGRRCLRLPGAANLAVALLQAPGEHAVLAQRLDLLGGIAELREYFTAVLPDDQGRTLYASRSLGKIEQQPDLIEPADEWMLVGGHPAARLELRIIVQAQGELRIRHFARYPRRIQQGEPLSRSTLAQL